jgi:hypothetical protein
MKSPDSTKKIVDTSEKDKTRKSDKTGKNSGTGSNKVVKKDSKKEDSMKSGSSQRSVKSNGRGIDISKKNYKINGEKSTSMKDVKELPSKSEKKI